MRSFLVFLCLSCASVANVGTDDDVSVLSDDVTTTVTVLGEDLFTCAAFDYTPIDFGLIQPQYGLGTSEVLVTVGGSCTFRYEALVILPDPAIVQPYSVLAFYGQPVVLAFDGQVPLQMPFSITYTGQPESEDREVVDQVTLEFKQLDLRNQFTGQTFRETFDVRAVFTWREPPRAVLEVYYSPERIKSVGLGSGGASSITVAPGTTLYFSGAKSTAADGATITYEWRHSWLDLEGGGATTAPFLPSADVAEPSLRFDQCGSHTITLRVGDGSMISNEWDGAFQVYVECDAPVPPVLP